MIALKTFIPAAALAASVNAIGCYHKGKVFSPMHADGVGGSDTTEQVTRHQHDLQHCRRQNIHSLQHLGSLRRRKAIDRIEC
jgi:hypothetical protein